MSVFRRALNVLGSRLHAKHMLSSIVRPSQSDSKNYAKRKLAMFASCAGVAAALALKDYHAAAEAQPQSMAPPCQCGGWDSNWDMRASKKVEEEKKAEGDAPATKAKRTVTRHIVLVRHGQYVASSKDEECVLSELGKRQADLTGQRLKAMNVKFSKIYFSTMMRARQTAEIIKQYFPEVPAERCELSREGAPIRPVPPPSTTAWSPAEHLFFQEGARIEAAFRKYFYRPPESQVTDTYELVVCHGNVIRYFVCRALQIPPEAWLRFSIHNCGLTFVAINSNGDVSVRGVGDVGHMKPEETTSN
eukprot:Colp12_sorted_trinity150504_noHs@32075